jgi:hypothetical protein
VKKYFPLWAIVLGFCFGLGTNLLNARGIGKYEDAAGADLTTIAACAITAFIGLFHALTCIHASRESWQTEPERFDIAFAASYVIGISVVTPLFASTAITALSPLCVYGLAFAGTCSKDERSIKDIIMRRNRATFVGGLS